MKLNALLVVVISPPLTSISLVNSTSPVNLPVPTTTRFLSRFLNGLTISLTAVLTPSLPPLVVMTLKVEISLGFELSPPTKNALS